MFGYLVFIVPCFLSASFLKSRVFSFPEQFLKNGLFKTPPDASPKTGQSIYKTASEKTK